ncbi:MAG: hypothetical protein ACTSWY_10690 [Promethearchaeota archaeon]
MSEPSQNTWKIKITNKEKAHNLKLFDANHIFGEYLKVNRNYFDELIDALGISKNYTTNKGITEVIGNDGKNWTKNPWLLLIAKYKERKAPIWILFKRENDLNGFLVALGPNIFYKYVFSSSEKKEDIYRILEYIIVYKTKWQVTIFLPAFLS